MVWSERFASKGGDSQGAGSRRFAIAVFAALAVASILLVVMRLDKSTNNLKTYSGPCLEVHGAQYDDLESYEELHDQQVMGLYPQEFRLRLNWNAVDADGNEVNKNNLFYRFVGEDNNGHFAAADLDSPVKITLTGSRGNEVDYKITSTDGNQSKVWNASAVMPKQCDLENPVGTWRLVVAAPKQAWAHTTWLTVREDGTGEFGSIDKNVHSAKAAELAKATHPCTVTYEKVPNGVKLVARYEGGVYVLTMTEG